MMMLRTFSTVVVALLLCAFPGTDSASAQNNFAITEPKKITPRVKIAKGEGIVQISVRSQKQFIDTAIIYFAKIDEILVDQQFVIRFERKAGVPIMGSNMIDEKQIVYRVPVGRYRLLAFTVSCDQMPYKPGLYCNGAYGIDYPAGFLMEGEPIFEVREGEFTQAGDFIIEYIGEKPAAGQSLYDVKDRVSDWAVRWRENFGATKGYELRPLNRASVPQEMRSRISCNARPSGVALYIPFDC